eukprot:358229-Chlamydomonas_euryale.AAC.14
MHQDNVDCMTDPGRNFLSRGRAGQAQHSDAHGSPGTPAGVTWPADSTRAPTHTHRQSKAAFVQTTGACSQAMCKLHNLRDAFPAPLVEQETALRENASVSSFDGIQAAVRMSVAPGRAMPPSLCRSCLAWAVAPLR